jgi:hypothetical protein
VVHRLRLDAATVEKVPGDQNEGDPLPNGIFLQAIFPGEEKVSSAVIGSIASDAEVNIRNVKEFGHFQPFWSRRRSIPRTNQRPGNVSPPSSSLGLIAKHSAARYDGKIVTSERKACNYHKG